MQDLGETETPTYRLLCGGGGTTLLVTQLRMRGGTIHCKHNCLLQNRERGVVEAVEQVEDVIIIIIIIIMEQVEDRVTVTREEDLFSLIDSKSFTSSGDEDGSPYCVLVEEEVEVVEAPQVLTIEEEEEEESSTIFSPHFSDPLLCSINRPSSTIVSVRYIHACTVDIGQPLYSNNIQFKDETMRRAWCWRQAATSCWKRRMPPSPSWRRCKTRRWRWISQILLFFFSFVFQEVQTAELEVLEIDSIQALRTDQVFLEGCGLESLKSVNETTTLRKSDSRCSSTHTAYNYTMTSIGVEPGEKSSVLKCLLQDPEFGKSRGRIKVV